MADNNARAPILDIHTLVSGAPIRIDGKRYTVRHTDSLSLEAKLQFEETIPRLGGLLQRVKTLSAVERTEMATLLDRVCRLVLDAPPAVHRALRDTARLEILQVFIRLRPSGRTGGTTTPRSRSTGATSSRGSRASTRARRSSSGTDKSRSD